MQRRVLATVVLILVLGYHIPGCMSVPPAPLTSDDSYSLGVYRRTFHRNLQDVARVLQQAMSDLSLRRVTQTDDFWTIQIHAIKDGRYEVTIKLELERGTPERAPQPIIGIVTRVEVKVGDLGDKEFSRKLLDRVETLLRGSPPRG